MRRSRRNRDYPRTAPKVNALRLRPPSLPVLLLSLLQLLADSLYCVRIVGTNGTPPFFILLSYVISTNANNNHKTRDHSHSPLSTYLSSKYISSAVHFGCMNKDAGCEDQIYNLLIPSEPPRWWLLQDEVDLQEASSASLYDFGGYCVGSGRLTFSLVGLAELISTPLTPTPLGMGLV
jgi:hypothetical protein